MSDLGVAAVNCGPGVSFVRCSTVFSLRCDSLESQSRSFSVDFSPDSVLLACVYCIGTRAMQRASPCSQVTCFWLPVALCRCSVDVIIMRDHHRNHAAVLFTPRQALSDCLQRKRPSEPPSGAARCSFVVLARSCTDPGLLGALVLGAATACVSFMPIQISWQNAVGDLTPFGGWRPQRVLLLAKVAIAEKDRRGVRW